MSSTGASGSVRGMRRKRSGTSGSVHSAPAAAIRHTTAAAGQSANGAAASRKPPTAGPTVPASPTRASAPRSSGREGDRADLGDERLVRRAVEAFADAEDRERDQDHEERGATRQPVAARVDHQPRHDPEQRHQCERAQPPVPLDRAAIGSCTITITLVLTKNTTPI